MEYVDKVWPAPAQTSAAGFFSLLNESGIRYGVFKSSRSTAMALVGQQDLDILVAREDYRGFCSIAMACAGIRSVNHSSLVSPGREDWFIPDFGRGLFLHLDVHVDIRLGGKFNKRYSAFSYGSIRHWNVVTIAGCSIPVASAQDEACITLSRIAFRASGRIRGPWQKLTGGWAEEIDDLLFAGAGTGHQTIQHDIGGSMVRCRIKKLNKELWVRRGDLAYLRQVVRARCGASIYAAAADRVANGLRASYYSVSRAFNKMLPGAVMDRRRPASGGLVVAVVAPDGLGKTTQVGRMVELFEWKFCTTRLYLGTGEGEGWWLRRAIRNLYIGRRARIAAALQADIQSRGQRRDAKAGLRSILLSAWGVLVALERYQHVRMARRMADRGFLVFCDRWPQALQPGFLDGPTARAPGAPTNILRRWELSIYDRMCHLEPDVMIHLVGDHAISHRRKPDEISRSEFEKRLALMEEMRLRTPSIRVINAAGRIDEVSRSLFPMIWNAL